jgi:hypothetical protein
MKRTAILIAALALALLAPAGAAAAPAPAWTITATPLPSNFVPGQKAEYLLMATNVGASATTDPSLLSATLPATLTPLHNEPRNQTPGSPNPLCAISGQTVSCEAADAVGPGFRFFDLLEVEVAPAVSGTAPLSVTVSGGAAASASTTASPPLSSAVLPFGFLEPGLRAPITEEDGAAATAAASHPYQQTVSFGFPSEASGEDLPTNDGHPHEIKLELPPGLIGNPTATPVLCTEAQLEAASCPKPSQVGSFSLATTGGQKGTAAPDREAIYNMVPPPGTPAELGINVDGIGLFAHLFADVRTDSDYGIEVTTPDVIALGTEPLFDIQAQVWGDPSDPVHDAIRGAGVGAQKIAFWTLPTHCSGQPDQTAIRGDSWEAPGVFEESTYQSADLAADPVSVSGCNQIAFEPTISARPSTDLADSPSGLAVHLHLPQNTELGHRATAQLRDATVTLPAGMAVNPSQADGLEACSAARIGMLTAVGASPAHFSRQPAACPDASKLGTVEVTTPLLAEYTEGGTRLATDPETGLPIPRPLNGSVYLAKPFENPFESLLALYLTVEDPKTGTFVKLAGRVEPDPATGQLTTVFSENPQLPIEDIDLELSGGARGALITPPTCATHTTTTTLVPWSAPEGAPAHPSDSFQTTREPGGGSCPGTEAELPAAPGFAAGTLTRQAGSYSPFALKVSREDGSRRISGIDTTLAPGLTGRLAGIPECSEAQIARARARSNPEEGRLERESPSCPLASELGTVTVAAGAGPTPYYAQGRAYLAPPYKGAPLSLVAIVPAIAGPFDLGTVVSRVALHVDPDTAQIHAVSDPLPQILDGIPLDVRSVALKMDRPRFVLNPTSCDPMAIAGSIASPLGQSTAVSTPFQVGGCQALPFKPRLSLALKGPVGRTSHPRLLATLKARPGEADVAAARVKLPPAVFLDQGHIRGVCTRVQFAAEACPAGSVYGRARARTPLLDQPLSGPVYLRSSSHPLPDLVAKLRGPASQPIEIDLAGRTDAVKAALRNTFEAVPDAPVSSFRLELFGGRRGLVEMSDGFCSHRRANVELTGQNAKSHATRPVVAARCPKGKGKRGKGKKAHRGVRRR